MCGIGGALAQRVLLPGLLQRLAPALAHRGPDGAGSEIIAFSGEEGRALGLVHRRLAVIDPTDTGHQPMRDSATGNWISFNGEIYNFRVLRRRLQGLGHAFTTASDTEVVLKAYAEWGEDCLQELRGMFAFALWDQVTQRLLLAVDRFGIKPLYYFRGDGMLLFASEVRALLATEQIPRRLDPAGLASYLAFGSVQAPCAIVRGIHCMRPGTYAVVEPGGEIERAGSYWAPNFARSGEAASGRADDLRELLQEAVDLHLVSDVPIALFLSGGIDSSSLVALAARNSALQTFSVVFPETDFSEAPYSRLIARRYATEHHEINLDDDACLDLIPDALVAMDQPTADGINVWAISRVVSQAGFKVVLSGQGGDEILTGYSIYHQAQVYMRWQPLIHLMPASLRRVLGDILRRGSGREHSGNKLADLLQASDKTALSAHLILRALFLRGVRDKIAPRCAGQLADGLPEEVAVELRRWGADLDPVNRVSLYEMRTYLANTLLRDSDVMGMAHGLEIRVPFLDHGLVERVAAISGRYKYGVHRPKPLLLDAMGDLLPGEIAYRAKKGFTFPWEYWLRGKLRPRVDSVLGAGDLGEQIGLDAEVCRRLWGDFQKRRGGVTWSRVWGLFCLHAWCARHGMKL